jgi:hypothetical protein
MNTNRTGMRTFLAAAAAGALIMGSAAGAMATPKDKPADKPGYVQLTKVDFHRHSPVNVYTNLADPTKSAVTRDLVLRATVRDTAKATGADPTSVKVTVAQYTKKHGDFVLGGFTKEVTLDLNKTKKNEKTYKGTVLGTDLKTAFASLLAGGMAYVCIDNAVVSAPEGVTVANDRKMVTKKEKGGDCVRIINQAPDDTKTKSDDPKDS